jgi:hypothetical protein
MLCKGREINIMANFVVPNPETRKVVSGKWFVFFALVAVLATTLILVIVQQTCTLPSTSPLPTAPKDQMDAYLSCLAQYRLWAVVTFLADLLAVSGVVLGVGYAVTGYPSGIALSSWNDYSLSKLQMALWTIVVLAGLLTAAKINLLGYFGSVPADKEALGINIPPELLIALGIAAASTAATPSILALKASQDPRPGEADVAKQRVAAISSNASTADVTYTGRAVGRRDRTTASWLDIVTGDETANAGLVDLSKVQQLLITVLLLGTYTFLLIQRFSGKPEWINSLPPIGQQFIWLLAVSHAGYLGYKIAPKSGQTDSTAAPGQAGGGGGAAGGAGAPPPNPPPATVPVRLATAGADPTSIKLQVDGRSVDVDANGFAELILETGIAHTVTASGANAGVAVSGQTTISVSPDDLDQAYELTLS